MPTNPVLGIDFGTTNTKAAWIDHKGTLHVVPVSERSHILPSVVWFKARDRYVVGAEALRMVIDDPRNTIHAPKRFIGRPFRSHFVSHARERFSYDIVEGEGGKAAVMVHGQAVGFTEIAFNVIHRMVELANAAAGEDFDECVLTVPAHFGYSQRQALRAAAEMGGLDVRGIVNEPTAAALYTAKKRGIEQTILVYDLGGGTFDISLVAIRGSLVLVLASGGDPFLGGSDFDEQIARRLVERFENQHGVEVQNNRTLMQRVIFAAERAKIELSTAEQSTIRVPMLAYKGTQPLDFEHALTRDALELLTSNLIEKTLGASEQLVRKAGMAPPDIDELVFVGGQTRMLALQRRMAAAFRSDPGKNINPELGVAVGAAILGRGLGMPGGPDLVDVVSIPIGVIIPGLGSTEVIPRNTGIPCVRRTTIQQLPALGNPLVVGVYEAVDAQSVDREFLGSLRIEAGWLAQHAGELTLELKLDQDFDLTALVTSADGASLDLKLQAPR
ncbi:MAG: Hsp70 family protein [Pseudomonadota bacterium]